MWLFYPIHYDITSEVIKLLKLKFLLTVAKRGPCRMCKKIISSFSEFYNAIVTIKQDGTSKDNQRGSAKAYWLMYYIYYHQSVQISLACF